MKQTTIEFKNGVRVVVDVGPPVPIFSFSREEPALIFGVCRRTSLDNWAYVRLITVSWHWPPIRQATATFERSMGEEEDAQDSSEDS